MQRELTRLRREQTENRKNRKIEEGIIGDRPQTARDSREKFGRSNTAQKQRITRDSSEKHPMGRSSTLENSEPKNRLRSAQKEESIGRNRPSTPSLSTPSPFPISASSKKKAKNTKQALANTPNPHGPHAHTGDGEGSMQKQGEKRRGKNKPTPTSKKQNKVKRTHTHQQHTSSDRNKPNFKFHIPPTPKGNFFNPFQNIFGPKKKESQEINLCNISVFFFSFL